MNIFILILVAIFMGGYYMLSSPSRILEHHDTQYAINRSDLRSIAQCAAAVHNAQINETEFSDVCVTDNNIVSEFICLDSKLKKTKCENVRGNKPSFSYIVTATAPLDASNHNDMMEILETYYSDAGTFGLLYENSIMSGGTVSKRIVPAEIISEMNLSDGQLVYLTQYEIPDAGTGEEIGLPSVDIVCPVGTAKTYRFGRWQCVAYNTKTDCGGDMIWDSDLYECVPDQSRKPLCATNQTAVLVDSVWECIDPFPDKKCPDKMIARLNYNTLEWECVVDPASHVDTKKCSNITGGHLYGKLTPMLHIPQTSCTDCERMIVDSETCVAKCVPDPSRISDASCYPGDVNECSGPTRALFFGFPNRAYISTVDAVADIAVPLDQGHSQNRRFNCMDCGMNNIDRSRSRPPYVAVCEK